MDGIEREVAGSVPVLRLDVGSRVGGSLAGRYQVRGVPTLLVLDSTGKVVLRQVGRLDRSAVLERVAR
ncbi:MAG: TlpA family protein disulfide reductase [Anaerolineae bacterium]